MKTFILCVGKTKAPYLDDEAHYLKMLRRHLPVEVVPVGGDEELVRRLPDAPAYVVALDERGRSRSSEEWAAWIDERRMAGVDLWLLIGGHEGLPREALTRADERISFGSQTLAHQLARIVLLEQLFRASKIAAGEKYHY